MTDQEIIAKHDPQVRARARMELAIVKATIRALHNAGYDLREGEDNRVLGERALLDLLFNLDDAYLKAMHGSQCKGWVRFVFGNDGWDVINDYTTNLETVLEPVNKLADSFCN